MANPSIHCLHDGYITTAITYARIHRACGASVVEALGDRARVEVSCDSCGEGWKGERRDLSNAPQWVRDSMERKAPEPETATEASARAAVITKAARELGEACRLFSVKLAAANEAFRAVVRRSKRSL